MTSTRKWTGTYTEFDDSFELPYHTYEVHDAVVTKERVAIDWTEDGSAFGTSLVPRIEDGFEVWRGAITCRSNRSACGAMWGHRHDLKDSGVLLIVHWEFADDSGSGMVKLYREWA